MILTWSFDYVTRHALVQDTSCSLYSCHSTHAWSYCTLYMIYYSVYSYQCYIFQFSLIHCSFVLMSYLYYYSTIILLFLLFLPFLCAFDGPVPTNVDFLAPELEETVEPLYEGIEGDNQAWVPRSLSFVVFWYFVLLWQLDDITFLYFVMYLDSYISRCLMERCIPYMW